MIFLYLVILWKYKYVKIASETRRKPIYAGVLERCDVKRFINTYTYIIRL